MAYRDPEADRAKDRERFRRRVERRKAAGLCPRCGDRPPAPERSLCAPCGEKRNRADRDRDARLRAVGKPRRDRSKAREYERGRARHETAKRTALGLCIRCGERPPMPGRKSCEPCLEKRREADRARYREGKALGKPYGGADPNVKRRAGRARSRLRQKARTEAGLCIRCGARPPVEGGTACQPCCDRRQAAEKRKYAERRVAGRCTRCGGPAFDGQSRCAVCAAVEQAASNPEGKNRKSRRRYALRRARGLCTACGAPAQGAARCAPCAERSYHGSAHFKGIPIWDPIWTVIELATGREHGPFDSEADVALCLAFEKLDRGQVEIVSDASPMSRYTSWG